MSGRSKYEFWKEASLSQKLADKDPIYQQLAGSDPEISEAIGILLVLCELGVMDKKDPNVKMILAILDVKRKARFATSERTNEITKMGLQMPKAEDIISEF
jgi:hypothetical protein